LSGLSKLLKLFELERIEENIFRGISYDLGFPNLFGGHVLGQALLAATHTVDAARPAHSLHAYFLRPGDVSAPVVYQVDRIRDGRSFTTRHVLAIQHGRPIFDLSCSFQDVEPGFEHQEQMPEGITPPEELRSERQIYEAVVDRIPEHLRDALTRERPVEIRPVDPKEKVNREPRAATKHIWFRAIDKMPDDPQLHSAVLAYASDFELLGTGMLPHGIKFQDPGVQAASLDHALWIHRPFRVDEWLLYSMDSPSAADSRVLTRGKIFRRDGALVASVVQEGLVRKR